MSSAPSGDGASVIVAIPARNEEERVAACLQAFAAQTARDGTPLARGTFEVLLLVNNSDDATADRARSLASVLPFDLDVRDVELPPDDATAGGARRLVMAEAARRLTARSCANGVLMTTDADTRVPPRWVADILDVIAFGVDAVVGGLRLDAAEEAALPPALRRRGALEGRYDALLCELQCRLDPIPHDPWPRHTCEPGASLALTLDSFAAIGGVPKRALGEDRAICDALRQGGFRIRHASEATVTTSGRLVGRARGRLRRHDAPADRGSRRAMRSDARAGLVGRPALSHAAAAPLVADASGRSSPKPAAADPACRSDLVASSSAVGPWRAFTSDARRRSLPALVVRRLRSTYIGNEGGRPRAADRSRPLRGSSRW